ncbi:MAG TPA: glucokinase [Pirellulales bacterium]|nr:glucokinase [Pirellulales bacterium]
MILAGDVGGTKTNVGFFQVEGHGRSLRVTSVVEQTYHSREHASLDELALAFLNQHKLQASVACFGVAGPVRHGHSQATNLPWTIDAARLTAELRVERTLLINDLEANAWGVAQLDERDFAVLNQGAADSEGNAAVISAGTGLGEAGLYWDGRRHLPFGCEGGHADFSPRNALESGLLAFLLEEFGHASWERVLSGPGLHNVYRYLCRIKPGAESPEVAREIATGDPPAVISLAAQQGCCPICTEAMGLFVSLYGAEAGNLALKLMATDGVYLGGGIAPKNVAALRQGDFMRSFAAKGRMRPVLEAVPVRVILSAKAALLGAARCAATRSPLAPQAEGP